ncbi:MAG: hypothetical protein H8E16_02125 [Flavobacteriales bacterium]|nr:hypothetical protein [Flavobacteriales bacterium]
MFKEEKKIITSWWFYFLGLILITIIVGSFMKYFGMIGKTVVERVVFENSYQRSETMKSREIGYLVQLSQVNSMLATETDPEKINYLKAQEAMLNTQLSLTKGMK